MEVEQALKWADTWGPVPEHPPSGDAQALMSLAGEVRRLRDCAGRVIAAFEALGRTNDVAGLLTARARCESVMLELRSVLPPNV